MGGIKYNIYDIQFNSLIKDQLYHLDENLDLAIESYVKIPLLIQTVHGRATKGHGLFNGESRPNITMDEICLACNIDPQTMRGYRQQIAYDTKQNAIDIINGKKNTLTNRRGEPLGGVQFLEGVKIDGKKEASIGWAIGGKMDTALSRKYTEYLYSTTLDGKKFRMGYGKEYPVNKKRLEELCISFESLSNNAHSKEDIKNYKLNGIIAKYEDIRKPNIENKFIRYNSGLGICDDKAMISIGRKYGTTAMKTCFITDMIDTYTKFNNDEICGGEDELLGKIVEQMWFDKYNEELITPEEISEIIYLGAKNNMNIGLHSSSHRYFVQKESNSGLATFMHHENFVRFGKMGNFKMGFEKLNSKKFYRNMNNEFEAINKLGTVNGNDYRILTK